MFTGLIEGIGRVKEIIRVKNELRLTLVPLFVMKDVGVGDSLAVDGICLTISDIKDATLTMDVSAETIASSAVGYLREGDEVNLERALRLGDRLGGHLVYGHVDGVGKILHKESKHGSWLLRIGVPAELAKYTIDKGSVAVDGISLTVNVCRETDFEVNIIPQTGKETTILKKKVGNLVNIETDLIGRYVEKILCKGNLQAQKKKPSVIDKEMLNKYGFGGDSL